MARDRERLLAGVELGGTKCICILATGEGDVRERIELPTRDPRETLDAIGDALARWRFAALGIASFGPLDLDPGSAGYGSIVATPKPGWAGTGLLGLAQGGPVAIDTDVNGAALAEGLWGGARGLESWVYVTVGTGIGVGTIVSRRAIRGLGHSEAGHLRVPRGADRWPGICPFHGDCAEGLASGAAIEARTGASARDLPAGDPAWPLVADTLAALCHNLVFTVAPQRILMGGGVPIGRPHLFALVRERLAASLGGYAAGAEIGRSIDTYLVPPALGALAGPLGAIALARTAISRA